MITCVWKMRTREEQRVTLEVTSLGSYLFCILVIERKATGGRICLGRKEVDPFCTVTNSHPGEDF